MCKQVQNAQRSTMKNDLTTNSTILPSKTISIGSDKLMEDYHRTIYLYKVKRTVLMYNNGTINQGQLGQTKQKVTNKKSNLLFVK